MDCRAKWRILDGWNAQLSSRQASGYAAVGFALAVLLLAVLEATHTKTDPVIPSDNERVLKLMVCVLLAVQTSLISLITAIPALLKRDWWPLAWLVPLVVGWHLLLGYLLSTFHNWHPLG
jgi:hypothetical protein